METGPCFKDPHPANKRVDMALVDVAATTIVVVVLKLELLLDYDLLTICPHLIAAVSLLLLTGSREC